MSKFILKTFQDKLVKMTSNPKILVFYTANFKMCKVVFIVLKYLYNDIHPN